jgi:hypothetical protein
VLIVLETAGNLSTFGSITSKILHSAHADIFVFVFGVFI